MPAHPRLGCRCNSKESVVCPYCIAGVLVNRQEVMLGVQHGTSDAADFPLIGQEGDASKVVQKEAMLAALREDAGYLRDKGFLKENADCVGAQPQEIWRQALGEGWCARRADHVPHTPLKLGGQSLHRGCQGSIAGCTQPDCGAPRPAVADLWTSRQGQQFGRTHG